MRAVNVAFHVTSYQRSLIDPMLRMLDAEERNRAGKFRLYGDMFDFVAAHALRRMILSRHVHGNKPPQDWRFYHARGEKPRLVDSPLDINISHCPGLVAVILGENLQCGIDVEYTERFRLGQLPSTFFSTNERRWLSQLPEAKVRLGFFCLWTLKEAFVKATGDGLAKDFDKFSLSVQPPRLLDECIGHEWHFTQFLVTKSHVLATACKNDTAPLYYVTTTGFAVCPRKGDLALIEYPFNPEISLALANSF